MSGLFEIIFLDTMKNRKYLLLTVFLLIIIVFLIYSRNNADTTNLNLQTSIISVPVDVYIIKYDDEDLSSTRNEENILEVFENVNSLWSKADIKIDVMKIDVVTIKDSNHYYDLNSILSYMAEEGNYNQNRINAYFAESLHGSNGIAFPGNRIMVADRTSVYDFRATSHEIGHVLGLSHVDPVQRLMARGVNGFDLSLEEIRVARSNAERKFY